MPRAEEEAVTAYQGATKQFFDALGFKELQPVEMQTVRDFRASLLDISLTQFLAMSWKPALPPSSAGLLADAAACTPAATVTVTPGVDRTGIPLASNISVDVILYTFEEAYGAAKNGLDILAARQEDIQRNWHSMCVSCGKPGISKKPWIET